jgi:hypothetical protein
MANAANGAALALRQEALTVESALGSVAKMAEYGNDVVVVPADDSAFLRRSRALFFRKSCDPLLWPSARCRLPSLTCQ